MFGELKTWKQNPSLLDKNIFLVLYSMHQTIYSFQIVFNKQFLTAFSTDHSSVSCSFIKRLTYSKGPGFWKFNNWLISNHNFAEEMRFFIHNTKHFLEQNISFSNQSKQGFLKYLPQKFQLKNLAINMLICCEKSLSLSKILIVKKNLKKMIKQGADLKKYRIKLQKA